MSMNPLAAVLQASREYSLYAVRNTTLVRGLIFSSSRHRSRPLVLRSSDRTEPNELHRLSAQVTNQTVEIYCMMMPTREDLWTVGVLVNTETFSGQSTRAAENRHVTIFFNYPIAESDPEQMPYVHAICYMDDVYEGVGAINTQMA